MKSAMLVSTMLLFAVIHNPAQAAEGTKIPACQAPFSACQAAGFKVGAHKKGDKEGADNGLWVDCIDGVADGKKQVSGVDPAEAQACKAAQHGQKHK